MKHLVILALTGWPVLVTEFQQPHPVPSVQKQISSGAEPFRRKLGTITGPDGAVIYSVITQFSTVPAAAQRHGQSSITFLDKNQAVVAKYFVGLPEELPRKLIGNALVFTTSNQADNTEEYKQVIGPKLPDWLCVGSNNCFHKE